VSDKYTLSDHLWGYLQDYADKHRAKGNGFGFGLVTPNDVARTLSARYYKDGSKILVSRGEGKTPRRLTPRECARLMGYGSDFQIPVSPERLNLPVITTMHKENIQRSNITPVMDFLVNNCFPVDGHLIEFSEFYDKFIEWLGPTDEYYSKQRVSREIPPDYVKGRYFKNNHLVIANMSFDFGVEPSKPYYLNEGKVFDYGR